METKLIDLRGKVCPFPIIEVINMVENMKSEENFIFKIDDPLALKSIPEELSDYKDLKIITTKVNSYWEINITKA